MLPYKNLIVIDKTGSIAFYKQIAAQLINHIQKGLIQSGIFLPSSREMATILDIHRNTVIAAMKNLQPKTGLKLSREKVLAFLLTCL